MFSFVLVLVIKCTKKVKDYLNKLVFNQLKDVNLIYSTTNFATAPFISTR